jgi:hypothetical protein
VTAPTPASAEVALEHVRRHTCDAGIETPIICGCDSIVLVVCAACGEPLAVRTLPERELCAHGLEVIELAKQPGPWAHWSTWSGVGS